ncbi:lithostathine-1-beta-like [Branchiostoma floridae x Branchiostoma belcheri]
MPRDAETDAFLVSLYKSVHEDCSFWFGLHYQQKEGRFEWVDGSALGPYRSWAPGEPDKFPDGEDCVFYTTSQKWNDQKCHNKSPFICQNTQVSCPEGYTKLREICYKAFNTRKTFSDAAATCRADGGTLAMPRDARTNAFLSTLYNSVRDDRRFWLGLHDQREEGRFEWVDGSALGPYSSWAPGEPNDQGCCDDCVIYSARKKDKWSDEECHETFRFICQAAPERP